jgi:ferrous iron transport protein B
LLKENDFDLVVNVLNASQLERSLKLSLELMELHHPMLCVVNMIDETPKDFVDVEILSKKMGVDVIGTSATRKHNVSKLVHHIQSNLQQPKVATDLLADSNLQASIEHLSNAIESKATVLNRKKITITYRNALHLHADQKPFEYFAKGLLANDSKAIGLFERFEWYNEIKEVLTKEQQKLMKTYELEHMSDLFDVVFGNLAHSIFLSAVKDRKPVETVSDRPDTILLHKYLGIPVFMVLMWILFWLTFELGSLPAEGIESFFEMLSELAVTFIPNRSIQALIAEGILPGLAAVAIFIPNIVILFFGITLFESSGYMARVGFLFDGLLRRFGMHGKSVVALTSGFGCTVPAYMATRALKNTKDRLVVLFILGFLSCSAKLPVFVLLIGALFPAKYAGALLFAVYLIGVVTALLSSVVLRNTLFKGELEPFIMELPPYRFPTPSYLWSALYTRTMFYIRKAGIYIITISALIWFLGAYPKMPVSQENVDAQEEQYLQLEQSYLAHIGKAVSYLFAPMEFDWKMSVGLISGIAAKETIVSTLEVLYQHNPDYVGNLREQLHNYIDLPTGVAYLIFTALYLPCFAATVVFTRESGQLRYLFYLVFFSFGIAWSGALAAYFFLGSVI